MEFNSEYFVSTWNEVKELISKNHEEVPLFGHQLKIDTGFYLQMEEDGIYKLYTARVGSELVGYAGFILYQHPHHADKRHATQDVIFIKKSHRGHGSRFIRYCESELKNAGVDVVLQHVPASRDWSPVLIRSGYKELETTYFKEL